MSANVPRVCLENEVLPSLENCGKARPREAVSYTYLDALAVTGAADAHGYRCTQDSLDGGLGGSRRVICLSRRPREDGTPESVSTPESISMGRPRVHR